MSSFKTKQIFKAQKNTKHKGEHNFQPEHTPGVYSAMHTYTYRTSEKQKPRSCKFPKRTLKWLFTLTNILQASTITTESQYSLSRKPQTGRRRAAKGWGHRSARGFQTNRRHKSGKKVQIWPRESCLSSKPWWTSWKDEYCALVILKKKWEGTKRKIQVCIIVIFRKTDVKNKTTKIQKMKAEGPVQGRRITRSVWWTGGRGEHRGYTWEDTTSV